MTSRRQTRLAEGAMPQPWLVGRDSCTTCCASLCCSDFEPKLDCLGKSHGSTESRPSVISSELKRAAPDTEPHCSPVLRPDVVASGNRRGIVPDAAAQAQGRRIGRYGFCRRPISVLIRRDFQVCPGRPGFGRRTRSQASSNPVEPKRPSCPGSLRQAGGLCRHRLGR